MFGFIANGLTVATTVLFPIFASYKALQTSDPAILAPWLMYFVVLSLLTAVENTFDFILTWIPFYAWLRFLIHLYLILPGAQGASYLYSDHIEPFLYHHEREIDDFITQAHDRAKAAGLNYLQQAIEYIKVNFLGFAPQRPASPHLSGQTYAQSFMSRFAMPNARGRSDNLSNLVAQALSGASALYAGTGGASTTTADQTTGALHSGSANTLIPDSIRSASDRANYVASQRSRLEALLRQFDQEQDQLARNRETGARYAESGGLSKSRSETEFDRIERDEVVSSSPPPYPVTPPAFPRRTSSGWMPWNWRAQQAQGQPVSRSHDEDPLAYGRDDGRDRARASGYDMGGR
ncbi:hypothetical protein M011DRAFT_495860 [Sporormia fimetaria CBS 119925]|uniref:Protein YOP1 n=1 Tax=Sporormia fimetaria CBS 119925 TaxID=1340428 RepID=A0A6A6V3S4_9PLEO|nr:hypothetical protein M011DRAFT_495860 [Sporormia fimetaria CBS 119925]